MIRANTPRRPRELQRLSSLGDASVDFLPAVQNQLMKYGLGYHREAKDSEGFRMKTVESKGIRLFLKVNKGPEGSPGETYDLDTNESIETHERQALLSGLRAMFVVPPNSYYGLLFVERAGRRNLKGLIQDRVITQLAVLSQTVIRVESFAESSDWERLLEHDQTFRVSQLLKITSSADDASTPEDSVVKLILEGQGARRLGARLKNLIPRRQREREERLDQWARLAELRQLRVAASKDGVTFQNEAEYQDLAALVTASRGSLGDDELHETLTAAMPVTPQPELTHRRWDVTTGDRKPERTFVVESDTLPQFVYELGERLTDGDLRNTWLDHAEQILKNRGVTLPPGWMPAAL